MNSFDIEKKKMMEKEAPKFSSLINFEKKMKTVRTKFLIILENSKMLYQPK